MNFTLLINLKWGRQLGLKCSDLDYSPDSCCSAASERNDILFMVRMTGLLTQTQRQSKHPG